MTPHIPHHSSWDNAWVLQTTAKRVLGFITEGNQQSADKSWVLQTTAKRILGLITEGDQ